MWELGNPATFSNTIIRNFTSGLDTVEDPLLTFAAVFQSKQYGVTNATILDATNGQTFSGTSLSFSGETAYVLKLGDVGGGTAAEVATAMNKVYKLAGIAGTPSNPYGGEHLTVIGQTSAGDTVMYDLVNMTYKSYENPDIHNLGYVTGDELHHAATLIGVNTAHMVAHDF